MWIEDVNDHYECEACRDTKKIIIQHRFEEWPCFDCLAEEYNEEEMEMESD